jgi:hypothetical protein
LRSDNDPAVVLSSFKARLELAELEKRDPNLIAALKKKVEELTASKDGLASIPEPTGLSYEEALYLESDQSTVNAADHINRTREEPRDGGQERARPAPRKYEAYLVTAVGGIRYRLGTVARIGRSADCDICVESHGVSRHHARVQRLREGGYSVEDLGSRNGTYINQQKVTAAQRLRNGDRLRLAGAVLIFFEGVANLPVGARAHQPEAPEGGPNESRRKAGRRTSGRKWGRAQA